MSERKVLVGFIGEICAGKDTAEALLVKRLPEEMPGITIARHGFSPILVDTLKAFVAVPLGLENTDKFISRGTLLEWGIPLTRENIRTVHEIRSGFLNRQGGRTPDPSARENQIALSVDMNTRIGPGTLSRAAGKRIGEDAGEVATIVGLRWETDVEMLFSAPGGRLPILIGLTASEENRLARARARKQKAGEENLTLEGLRAFSKKPTEIHVARLLQEKSTLVIGNDGSQDDLAIAMHGVAKFIKAKLTGINP